MIFDIPHGEADSSAVIDVALRQIVSARSVAHRFFDEYVLGTRLEILVNATSAMLAQEAALAVRREIDRLDRVFNGRREDSEISALNKTRSMTASMDLFAVVQLSEQWRRISRGAFDGRMGELLKFWSATPEKGAIERALHSLRAREVKLEPMTRRIEHSSVHFGLDAIAKGYIVDAALDEARRAAPGIEGIAVSIGGDIRCWGDAPNCRGWRVGIPDPVRFADNSPLVDAISLTNAAIATSGRGPRDCMRNRYRSTTVSPFTGHPIREVISASAVASHAADADAIATACMVLAPNEGIAWANTHGIPVRITDARNQVHQSSAWPSLRVAAAIPAKAVSKKADVDKAGIAVKASSLPPERQWPADWEIGISYVAPERNVNERSADFRTPYMALWITDEKNRAVNTPVMVGSDPDWHHDNYVWWGSYGARAEEIIHLRSQATALSGRYRIFWSGWDDNMKPLPVGKYTLHLETSQERGKHEYRSVALDIGRERFKITLPSLPGSGGLVITYGHYNDRFKDE